MLLTTKFRLLRNTVSVPAFQSINSIFSMLLDFDISVAEIKLDIKFVAR